MCKCSGKFINLEINKEALDYLKKILYLDEEKNFSRIDKGLESAENGSYEINLNRYLQSAIYEAEYGECECETDKKRKIGFRPDGEEPEEEEVELEGEAWDDPNRVGFVVPPSSISNDPYDDEAFYNGEDV